MIRTDTTLDHNKTNDNPHERTSARALARLMRKLLPRSRRDQCNCPTGLKKVYAAGTSDVAQPRAASSQARNENVLKQLFNDSDEETETGQSLQLPNDDHVYVRPSTASSAHGDWLT